MSLYYNNSNYNLNINSEMIDLLLDSGTITKYISQSDMSRLTHLIPDGIEV
jgi:hypothetical protein